MTKKKSPRRNAAERGGGKAAGERSSSDKGSPSLAPVHADADQDDGGPGKPADVQEQKEGAAEAHPAEDVAHGRTLSPAEAARNAPSEAEDDAAAGVPAGRAAEKKRGKRDAEKGTKRDAAGAGRVKSEVSPGAEKLAGRPPAGENAGGTVPTVKEGGGAKDEERAAEAAAAEEPKPVGQPAPERELLDHIRNHEAPTFADLAKDFATADAEDNAIEAAAAAEQVPKPVDHPPDSELAELINHQEAPSFSEVAKHLVEIDAEEKAIDDAAAAKQVPNPDHHSRDSELVEHIMHHEAPTFVDAAKHAAQQEEVESKQTDEPVLKPETFPTLAEAEGARVAAHIVPQEMGVEVAENLVEKIVHNRAPSFAEIAKHPPHEMEHVEEDGPEWTTKEEEMDAGPARLRDPDEASDRDEESGDVFLSAMELEQQQGQQQQQEPAPVATEERTAEIVKAAVTAVVKAAEAAVSPAESAKAAVKKKASAAGATAHEEKEIFVAEPCRPTAGGGAGASRREVAKRKNAARVSLFIGAGSLAAAALAILGLTTRYRMRKGSAASLGTVVGAVVGLFGWMYARGRT